MAKLYTVQHYTDSNAEYIVKGTGTKDGYQFQFPVGTTPFIVTSKDNIVITSAGNILFKVDSQVGYLSNFIDYEEYGSMPTRGYVIVPTEHGEGNFNVYTVDFNNTNTPGQSHDGQAYSDKYIKCALVDLTGNGHFDNADIRTPSQQATPGQTPVGDGETEPPTIPPTGTLRHLDLLQFDIQTKPCNFNTLKPVPNNSNSGVDNTIPQSAVAPRFSGLNLNAFTDEELKWIGVDPTTSVKTVTDYTETFKYVIPGQSSSDTISLASGLSRNNTGSPIPLMHAALVSVQGYKIADHNLTNFGDIIANIDEIRDTLLKLQKTVLDLSIGCNNNFSSIVKNADTVDDEIIDIQNNISRLGDSKIGSASETQKALINSMISAYNLLSSDTITGVSGNEWENFTVEQKLEVLMKMIKVVLTNDNTYDYTLVTSDGEQDMSDHDAMV